MLFCDFLHTVEILYSVKVQIHIHYYQNTFEIMQKLYRTAFHQIWNKLGADKLESVNLATITALLKQKNIPLSEIDETLFHRMPREEVKNFFRNPCPVNNKEQTETEDVTTAKALRGSLNIVEKKICFKCPFVATCERAFLQPQQNFKVENPLQNLLITMKNISQIENQEKLRTRSWLSSLRVCDSLDSIIDDLLQGGQQFKRFKEERNNYVNSVQALQERQELSGNKQLIEKARKNKVPLKDTYAQIPTSRKQQNKAQRTQGQQQTKISEDGSKDPQDIFKRKKNEAFIKMAQKYIGEQGKQQDLQQKKQVANPYRRQLREQRTYQKRDKFNNNSQNFKNRQNRGYQNSRNFQRTSDRPTDDTQRRPYRNDGQRYPSNRDNQSSYQNKRFENKQNGYERNKSANNYERRTSSDRGASNYEKRTPERESSYERRITNQRGSSYERKGPSQRYNNNQRGETRRFDRNSSSQTEQDPKIRRFSKQDSRPQYQGERSTQRSSYGNRQNNRNPSSKFYSKMQDSKSQEEQILSSLNKRDYKSSRLPRDAAKLSNNFQGTQRGRKSFDSTMKEFSEGDLKQFDRLQKIPKILKTQFASKSDIKDRVAQQQTEEQPPTQRKGRRIKRD